MINITASLVTLSLIISSTISCMNLNDGDIFQAVKKGNINKVRQLIEQNPTLVNIVDNYQRTPLHIVAELGYVEIAQLLLQCGAEVNRLDDNEITSLQGAAVCDNPEIVKLLLQHGAKVNVRDNAGWTPLIFIAINGSLEVAHLLLQSGANITTQNNFGYTPLNLALKSNNPAVAQLFKDWPLYQSHRNRQISAFFGGLKHGNFNNFDSNILNNIAHYLRSKWKQDCIEQIHNVAEQERIYQIWISNKQQALVKTELQLIKK